MRGTVEIYSDGDLVYESNNLLVDGAGEAIADIMTVSPSLSGIATASSILDASNYTIQAISFGKGEKAYEKNAHAAFYLDNKYVFLGSLGVTPAIVTHEEFPDITLSSYSPFSSELPAAPTPLDSQLENSSDVSAWGEPDAVDISGYVRGNGQNLNMIPLDYGSSILSAIPLFQITQGGPPASILGCYPDGSSLGGTEFYIFSSLGDLGINRANSVTPLSGVYNSIVNEASSMDVSGFVGKVYDAKNKVGVASNPNILKYTENFADDPGITFNSDLTGEFWQFGGDRWGSTSSVLETNPFGGASSIQLSATDDLSELDYWPIMNTIQAASLSSTHNLTFSCYVKQPTGEPQGVTRFGVNVYNYTESESTTCWFNFSGTAHGYAANGTPVFKGQAAGTGNYVGHKIEDAGNGWWRITESVSGVGDDADWTNADVMRVYCYLSDAEGAAANAFTNVAGSALWISGPQLEQHPISYNLSATPYQSVAGASPTVAEQQGEGCLHVSGGIDPDNLRTIEYSILVGSGDLGAANLYGGIYNMGLWTIDMEKSLKAGNTPPFSFHPISNPRKYKLFAKKGFTRNLCHIEDNLGLAAHLRNGITNYKDLTITWKIDFL
jgi:hypothetical protein